MAFVLRARSMLDGTGSLPTAASILVEGATISRVDANIKVRDAVALDLDGLTVLPGLIDAHSHLGLINVQDPARDSLAVTAAHIFRNCELALDAGFTTVRDVGGVDGGLARAIELGLVRGPRVFPSGPMLVQTGGHGDLGPPFLDPHHHYAGNPGLAQVSKVCDGLEEVRYAARSAFRLGATQLKVCVSGGVVSLSDELDHAQFSVPELRAAVEEAEARGSYVAAHAHGVRGIRNGLQAGVRTFEHGSFLDVATASEMAAQGAVLVPTLTVARVMQESWHDWGIPEESLVRIESAEVGMKNAIKLARDAGVVVGLGSDLLGPGQNRRGLELVLRAAVTDPMEAIVASTSINAGVLRIDDRIGTITEGKLADVIALDGDPLADPSIFDDPARVVFVMKNGVIVKDTRD